MMKKFWEMKQKSNDSADVYIYGEITSAKWEDDDTTASSFKKDLDALGNPKEVHLHINSPGGSVFEGIAIGNMLKASQSKVIAHVDALAASIASVIVANADEVIMPENAMLMIHNPFNVVMGNANELRKAADDLDSIAQASVITYLSKGGDKLDEEQIKEIMDNETWLSAQDAFDIGLCDEIEDSSKAVAKINDRLFECYQNVPNSIKQVIQENEHVEQDVKLQQVIAEAQQDKELMNLKQEEIYNG